MNLERELKRDLQKLKRDDLERDRELAKLEPLLTAQLTKPRGSRNLVNEYWVWLDRIYDGNFGDIREQTRTRQWRDAFNDPPPANVLGPHDPYQYMDDVKKYLIDGRKATLLFEKETARKRMMETLERLRATKSANAVVNSTALVWDGVPQFYKDPLPRRKRDLIKLRQELYARLATSMAGSQDNMLVTKKLEQLDRTLRPAWSPRDTIFLLVALGSLLFGILRWLK